MAKSKKPFSGEKTPETPAVKPVSANNDNQEILGCLRELLAASVSNQNYRMSQKLERAKIRASDLLAKHNG